MNDVRASIRSEYSMLGRCGSSTMLSEKLTVKYLELVINAWLIFMLLSPGLTLPSGSKSARDDLSPITP